MSENEDYKYWAFISYSHRDKSWGDWLHRSLETYRIPRKLSSQYTHALPDRLAPIFRDREELPTAHDLGSQITGALKQSRFLIVICSHNSAGSMWVNEEIKAFKAMGRANRVLCLIVEGEPNATDKGDPSSECFPEAVRFVVNNSGEVLGDRTEPIAADARPNGDGKRNALLKLAAGLLGVDYAALTQRERRRQMQRYMITGGVVLTLMLLALGQQYLNGLRLTDERNQTQLRLADSLMARGNMLLAQKESAQAKPLFRQAAKAYRERGVSPLAADLGTLISQEKSPDPIREMRPHDSPITEMAMDAQEKLLVSGDEAGAVTVSEIASGKLLHQIPAHGGKVLAVRVDADGLHAKSIGVDGKVSVLDLQAGRETDSVSFAGPGESWGEMIAARFMRNEGRVILLHVKKKAAVAGDKEEQAEAILRVFDLGLREVVQKISLGDAASKRMPTALELMPDDQSVILGMVDGAIHVSLQSAKMLGTLSSLAKPSAHALMYWYVVQQIAMSGDGRYVALGYSDNIVEFWDAANHNKLFSRRFFNNGIRSLAVAGDHGQADTLIVGGTDGSILRIDLHDGTEQPALMASDEPVTRIMPTAHAGALVAGGADGSVDQWSLGRALPARTIIDVPAEMLPEFDGSIDGSRVLVTAITSPTLHLYSGDQFEPLHKIEMPGEVMGARLSADAKRAWVALDSGRVSLWNLETGKEDRVLFERDGAESIEASANKLIFAVWTKKSGIRVFSADGSPIAKLEAPSGICDCLLKLDKEGVRLLAATRTSETAYALPSGKVLWTRALAGDDMIAGIALSSDGLRAATSYSNGTIEMNNAMSGVRLMRMRGHSAAAAGLAFAPGGGVLISGGQEGAVKLWQVDTGMELVSINGIAPVFRVAVMPTGKLVVTSMGDSAIYGNVNAYVWHIDRIAPGKP